MLVNKIVGLVLLIASFYQGACAQQTAEFYQPPQQEFKRGMGFRAGTNYSIPTVTAAVDPRTNINTYLFGVMPRFGYYAGGFIYRDLVPNQVLFQVDATLQMKGVGAEYQGRTTVKASYYYFGISPQIGLQLINQLTVYVGAEANTLIDSVHPWGKTYPFEIGAIVRLAYQVGQFGLEGSYIKGFTKYDSFNAITLPGGGSSTNDFYNQTIQFGLFYKLSR